MTFSNLKKVYRYGKKYRWNLILEIVGSIIGIIINIVLPILAAKQIVYLTANAWEQLILMSIIILVIHLIGNLKTVLIRTNTQKVTIGITNNIRSHLSHEILKISDQEFIKNSSGTFIGRLTNDTDELANMFTVGIGRITGVISNLGIFVSVFIINKYVFIYYLFVSFILTSLHLIKSNKVRIKDNLKRNQDEVVTSLVSELVRGVRDIKMLNAKSGFISNLKENIDEKNRRYLSMRNVDILYNYFIESLTAIFEFLLILLFIYLVKETILSVSMALALYSYKDNVMSNFMEKISQFLEEVNQFNLSCDRVFSILDNKIYKKEKFGTKHLHNIKGDFEFKDVSFHYENEVNVLNHLSFKVNANETVAFVGKSGAGKSTIFHLLCKMYEIDEGGITIDGVDIKELDEDSIRGNITIISQNPYIFNMSIKDNLKLVQSNVTDSEIVNACKLACLDEFIETLPNKYDTVVGEGGISLSGGQKQRLAIARALIQKTEIILFDEATSALDNETQSKIQDAIDNMKNEYTILMIAHRLSTIKNADRILYIENGRVLAEGSHEELLKSCIEYKKLYHSEIKTL